ncbi:MAG: GT4 family glycosyltransferase PelF [Verrucomicrobiae bacterium]
MRIPDACLLLEGTFPYVRGGVSGWVHRLIDLHPHLQFSIFFLGADRRAAAKRLYDMPDNVAEFREAFLFERPSADELRPAPLDPGTASELAEGLESVYFAADGEARILAAFAFSDWLRTRGKSVRFGNLLHERASWDVLRKAYALWFPTVSFIDFFWTCRIIHAPLWQMLRALPEVPHAAVYHSISTGYAGTIGALASRREGAPYILSEHGIYTKERMIEITQADWIHEPQGHGILAGPTRLALKNLWIGMFAFLGKLTYESANPIISLYSGNSRLQEEFGARAERVTIIPNGILPARFDAARKARSSQPQPSACRIGFLGRIVPIKDIKTLLRAARMLADALPDARVSLHGPTNEDQEYFEECLEMVEDLDLREAVSFHGSGRIEEILVGVDVLVLTSISEALPLVILEAFACGIPVVATDVGACRELLNGRTPEDKALGRGGILTGISSPSQTADALVRLARDHELRTTMGAAGFLRVMQFYNEKHVMSKYGALYKSLQGKGPAPWQA